MVLDSKWQMIGFWSMNLFPACLITSSRIICFFLPKKTYFLTLMIMKRSFEVDWWWMDTKLKTTFEDIFFSGWKQLSEIMDMFWIKRMVTLVNLGNVWFGNEIRTSMLTEMLIDRCARMHLFCCLNRNGKQKLNFELNKTFVSFSIKF